MHELSITQSILEIAIRHAQAANATKVTNLYLVIGQLSSVVDDSVQFYWDFISKDTLAEGAQLHFQRIPAKMLCKECQHRYSPDDDLTCPQCGSADIHVTAGTEFFLESIEVADAPVPT